MRIRVIFSVDNIGTVIPFHHQYLIAKMVRDVMVKGNLSQYPFYAFSGIKGQTKVTREGLQVLSNKVTVVFSSINPTFLQEFTGRMFSLFPKILIGNLRLVPLSVEEEEMPTYDGQQKYLCISPLSITDPRVNSEVHRRFVSPDSDEFSDYVYESTMMNIEKTGMFSAEEMATFFKFQIVPDKEYLERLRHDEKKLARVYTCYLGGVKYEVRGYTLPFTLYAEPKVHEFIFNLGVGALTQEGYGMIDIPQSEMKRDTIPYKVQAA